MAKDVQERRHEEAVSEHRGHDVFVSYSRADRDAVVRLTEGLASRGKRAWVDLDDIPPSAEWMAEIRQAIEGADGYVVAISPDVARSKVCSEELEHARSAGKRIVPVLVRTTDPDSVPESLASLNWIDATDGSVESAVDLASSNRPVDHVRALGGDVQDVQRLLGLGRSIGLKTQKDSEIEISVHVDECLSREGPRIGERGLFLRSRLRVPGFGSLDESHT